MRQVPLLLAGYPFSGRSTLLAALASRGFETLDDAGLDEARAFLAGGTENIPRAAALRDGEFPRERPGADREQKPAIIFLEAADRILVERGAKNEELQTLRRELRHLRRASDLVLNSCYTTSEEEADRSEALAAGKPFRPQASIEICSFGFKNGAEPGDVVFDVRFIPNPYYVYELRPLTGLDEACSSYVFDFESSRKTLDALTRLAETLLQTFREQGRDMLKICIGCTGGQHRSVAMTEALGKNLREADFTVKITHRELAKKLAC